MSIDRNPMVQRVPGYVPPAPKPFTPVKRVPLTTSQHILHLLLTVFTAGFWAPVWFVRAWRGNPAA